MQSGRPMHSLNEASTWQCKSDLPFVMLCVARLHLAEGYLRMAMELTCPCTSATVPDEEGMHGLWVALVGGLEPPLGAGNKV